MRSARLRATLAAGIVNCGKTVVQEEGVKALWKGLTPFATHLTLKYALRFGTNALYSNLLRDKVRHVKKFHIVFCCPEAIGTDGLCLSDLESLLVQHKLCDLVHPAEHTFAIFSEVMAQRTSKLWNAFVKPRAFWHTGGLVNTAPMV